MLHHLGESTLSDIKEVEAEVVKAGGKSVIVAGDIASEETATKVSRTCCCGCRSWRLAVGGLEGHRPRESSVFHHLPLSRRARQPA